MGFYVRNIFAVALCVLMSVLSSCSAEQETACGDPLECELMVKVDVADVQSGVTYASPGDEYSPYKDPVDGESLKSLRVMIVKGDGTVEHNAYYEFSGPRQTFGPERYKVSVNDSKTVILIGNEKNIHIDMPGDGTVAGNVYFGGMSVGDHVDVEEIRNLTISAENHLFEWNNGSMRNLPVTLLEKVKVGEEDMAKSFYLHRGAVKYTFRIKNSTRFKRTLTGIYIPGMSSMQYLFPKDAVYGESTPDTDRIPVATEYSTPADALVSDFSDTKLQVELPSGMSDRIVLPSYYFLEGVRRDTPYQATIGIDGYKFELRDLIWKYPETSVTRMMTDLPRNTHVVVDVDIKNNYDISCTVDVMPYSSVLLDPWFGLDRDEAGNIIIKNMN